MKMSNMQDIKIIIDKVYKANMKEKSIRDQRQDIGGLVITGRLGIGEPIIIIRRVKI